MKEISKALKVLKVLNGLRLMQAIAPLSVLCVLFALVLASATAAIGATTGMAVWRQSGSTTPKYSAWDGSSFGAKANSAAIDDSGSDFGCGIAVDSSENAYVTGFTSSSEATFPVTGGPDLTHNTGRH